MKFALQAAGVGMWEFFGQTISLCSQGRTVLGLHPTSPVSYESLLSSIHAADRFRINLALNRFHRGDLLSVCLEFRAARPHDPSSAWIQLKGKAQDAGNAKVSRFGGTVANLGRGIHEVKSRDEDYRILAETVPINVWRTDGDHNAVYFNRQWYLYTGLTEEQSIGKGYLSAVHIDDITPGAVNEADNEIEARKILGRETKPYELLLRLKNTKGEYRWFHSRSVSVVNKAGLPLYRIGISTDIDDQVKTRQLLEEARKAAISANAAKSAFLANMSHEIRTPIGVIMGYCELLKKPSLNDMQRHQYIHSLNHNSQELLHLINDLLDLAKIEAARIEIECIVVDPKQLFDKVIHSLRMKASEKSLAMTLNWARDVPDSIFTDPTRLRQILLNIVGNSIKFTREGSIDLNVDYRDFGNPPKKQLAIAVTDTGCGISEVNYNKLFRPFSQVEASTTRSYGGTGLGLMLSRQLANAMGGDVVLRSSRLGEGSTFLITIPAAIPGPEEALQTIPGLAGEFTIDQTPALRLKGLSLLFVDDAPDNQFIIGTFLRDEGASVDIAENGQVALDFAMKQDYDLILMDIQMPVMDGYQATRQLRKMGFSKPILALTACVTPDDLRRCYEADCDAILTKPILAEQLIATVAGHIKS